MPATKIGIVIATGSKMIRRVIVPDTDEQLEQPGWAGEGETLLIADAFPTNGDMADPANHAHVVIAIVKATGVEPPDPRCAVLDSDDKVTKFIAADPAIDAVEGHTLASAYSKEIIIGASLDKATGEFINPAYVIPAGTDKDGNPVAEKTVPEKRIEKSEAVAAEAEARL